MREIIENLLATVEAQAASLRAAADTNLQLVQTIRGLLAEKSTVTDEIAVVEPTVQEEEPTVQEETPAIVSVGVVDTVENDLPAVNADSLEATVEATVEEEPTVEPTVEATVEEEEEDVLEEPATVEEEEEDEPEEAPVVDPFRAILQASDAVAADVDADDADDLFSWEMDQVTAPSRKPRKNLKSRKNQKKAVKEYTPPSRTIRSVDDIYFDNGSDD